MSTRTRTRTTSAAAPSVKAATSKASKPPATTPKSKRNSDIENDRPKQKSSSKAANAKSSTPAVYCVCRKGDDGSPMVGCVECDEWYHFSCVGLNKDIADDINLYICHPCTEKTGRRTVMNWEGPDAVEEISNSNLKISKAGGSASLNGSSSRSTPAPVATKRGPKPEPAETEEAAEEAPEEDLSSGSEDEDEYVAKTRGAGAKRRRARRLSFSDESGGSGNSDSDSDADADRKPATLKRKATGSQKPAPPPAKRKKESSKSKSTGGGVGGPCARVLPRQARGHFPGYIPEVSAQELSEAEKAQVEDKAKQFAKELEQEKYRQLQFNLSKVDRTVLHKRIASGDITPKEIALMSSTDLANEQAKEAIRIAEKEALEHSILEKTTAIPRAKLTHKGLEDIELDAKGEEAERKEREMEHAARTQARQRTLSVSVPPESPITPTTPMSAVGPGPAGASWGGPPRVPTHAMAEEMPMAMAPPFGGEMSAEPEMNLADLINIDDEPGPPGAQDAHSDVSAPPAPAPVFDLAPSSPIPGFGRALSPEPLLSSPTIPTTGISPFASKPEAARTSSFDLNALWAAPKKEEDKDKDDAPVSPTVTTTSPPQQEQSHSPVPMEEPQDRKEEMMDLDETDDQDFDMFLEEKETDTVVSSPEALQAAFNDLPQVWSGKINMPLDSTIPQETPVVARQIGGRTIEFGSALWKTLFPSELLRIDGRVPVDKSAQFLLQTRLNSTKELVAVAFSPGSSGANAGFQILMDFLIAKGRHGLVFPWGSRPKDYCPGKELYIIPLLSSDSLPDYMELLDNLTLPKIRNANYLHRPPPPPAPVPTPALAPPPGAAVMPQPQPQFNMPPLPPAVPGAPAPQLTFEPSVLAAEVAALTPEQVRMMLQSLTASTLNAIPVPAPMSPMSPQGAGPPPQQPWGHPAIPGPSMGGFPPPMSHHLGPQQQHGPPYGQQPPYDRQNYNRDPHPGYDRGGRDNGWNNHGRGRGRGRGGPVGGGGGPPPADGGWPRRRDSGPSPPQRRWN
ncbi:Transcription elongation regulator [Mycena venus]|uniref:Transcription factor BYE1 n=1 Tax=Mycena venus TaxID=2733690 RepID=A0A8H6Y921_9AGAR|nr:Transcription elongation regulator [Mycena venus]